MKTKTLVLFSILCLAALIILGSCVTSQNPDKMVFERFCGVWANDAYEPKPGNYPPAYPKYIINPDGKFMGYPTMLETGPTMVGSYTVEERWTDEKGNSWYHIIITKTLSPAPQYELWKLDKYNSFLEINWSISGYPTKIDPKDKHSTYLILYRY